MTKRKCLNCKISKETATNYTRIPNGSYNNICIECKELSKNKPLTCYTCGKKKPRNEVIKQKCKECRETKYNKGSMKTTRKCFKCKEIKCSNTNYTENERYCNECVAKRPKENKCKHCGEMKLKEKFSTEGLKKRSNKCDDCKANPKKRWRKVVESEMPKVYSKKTPEVEKFRVNSHEERHHQRLTAHEALEIAKQREAELLASGRRYVKGEVRSFILR